MRIFFRIIIVLLFIWSIMDFATITKLEKDVAELKWHYLSTPRSK